MLTILHYIGEGNHQHVIHSTPLPIVIFVVNTYNECYIYIYLGISGKGVEPEDIE